MKSLAGESQAESQAGPESLHPESQPPAESLPAESQPAQESQSHVQAQPKSGRFMRVSL